MLTTERLLLRPYAKEDYAPYLAMVADPQPIAQWRSPISPEDAWHRVVRCVGHWALFGYGAFAILDCRSGRYLGETGFWDAHRGMGAAFDEDDETGWSIVAERQGRASRPRRRRPRIGGMRTASDARARSA